MSSTGPVRRSNSKSFRWLRTKRCCLPKINKIVHGSEYLDRALILGPVMLEKLNMPKALGAVIHIPASLVSTSYRIFAVNVVNQLDISDTRHWLLLNLHIRSYRILLMATFRLS